MNVEVFLIQSASLIHLVCHCAPLATTSALSQSMTWFCSTAWSVMADLWVMLLSLAQEARLCVPAVKESTSFQCSFILRPIFLPVSQCKNWGSSCKGSFTAGTQTRASILYPTGIGSIKRWCASDDVWRLSRKSWIFMGPQLLEARRAGRRRPGVRRVWAGTGPQRAAYRGGGISWRSPACSLLYSKINWNTSDVTVYVHVNLLGSVLNLITLCLKKCLWF